MDGKGKMPSRSKSLPPASTLLQAEEDGEGRGTPQAAISPPRTSIEKAQSYKTPLVQSFIVFDGTIIYPPFKKPPAKTRRVVKHKDPSRSLSNLFLNSTPETKHDSPPRKSVEDLPPLRKSVDTQKPIQFKIVSPSQTLFVLAESQQSFNNFKNLIDQERVKALAGGEEGHMNRDDFVIEDSPSSDDDDEDEDDYDERESGRRSLVDGRHVLRELKMKDPSNSFCAGCGTPEPEWVAVERDMMISILDTTTRLYQAVASTVNSETSLMLLQAQQAGKSTPTTKIHIASPDTPPKDNAHEPDVPSTPTDEPRSSSSPSPVSTSPPTTSVYRRPSSTDLNLHHPFHHRPFTTDPPPSNISFQISEDSKNRTGKNPRASGSSSFSSPTRQPEREQHVALHRYSGILAYAKHKMHVDASGASNKKPPLPLQAPASSPRLKEEQQQSPVSGSPSLSKSVSVSVLTTTPNAGPSSAGGTTVSRSKSTLDVRQDKETGVGDLVKGVWNGLVRRRVVDC
ncbi:hypothetical protein HDV05_000936 [Chytridiales sp. JEL 0842]|nr:hypothetical protein HDV05_000936 [Chytridiales sp. JEL 0842]